MKSMPFIAMKEISEEIWLWMMLGAWEVTVDQHELWCTGCGFLSTVTGEMTLFLGSSHADHTCSWCCALSECFSVSSWIQTVWRPCALSQPLTWQPHSTWNPCLGSSGCGFGHRSVSYAARFLTLSITLPVPHHSNVVFQQKEENVFSLKVRAVN